MLIERTDQLWGLLTTSLWKHYILWPLGDVYFSFQSFGNPQQGTGRFPGNVSGWGLQQLEHAGSEHCNPPAAAKPALGQGLHLQHPHSATEGVPLQKPEIHSGRDPLLGNMENWLKALSSGLFALPMPRQSQNQWHVLGWSRCALPPLLLLLSLRKRKIWFRTIKHQQCPDSSQGGLPTRKPVTWGAATNLSIPSLLHHQDFETANSGYEQLLERVFLSADEELISSTSWFK